MLLQSCNKLNISDNLYDSILNYWNTGTRPVLSTNALRKFITLANKYVFNNNKLYMDIKSKTLNTRSKQLELIPPRDRDNKLQQLYDDPLTMHNGRDSLYYKVISRYLNISRNYVFDWLKKQERYQIHVLKPREKWLRPEEVKNIGEKLMIDLIDLSGISGYNDQHKWVITAIDVFSKRAWARSMTQKTMDRVVVKLRVILRDYLNITGKYPDVIASDNGVEFKNTEVRDFLAPLGIEQFFGMTYLPQQQGNIERFNRTIKNQIFSYISKRKLANLPFAARYKDVLQKLVSNYNNSYHSSIKDTPANIHNGNRINQKQIDLVDKRIENFAKDNIIEHNINIHDHVRLHILTKGINRRKKRFAKMYHPQWSIEIYEVIRRINLNDPLKKTKYKVKMIRNLQGNIVNIDIPSTYYGHDLQVINN